MNVRGARLKSAVAAGAIVACAIAIAGILATGALSPAPLVGPVPLPSDLGSIRPSDAPHDPASATTPPTAVPSIDSIASGGHSPSPALSPALSPATGGSAASPSPLPAPSPTGGPVVALRIVIPDLGINLPIYAGDGVTVQPGYAAQYPTTSWPGGGTLIYLYAHARDRNFVRLWDARLGQQIQLVLEDGRTVTYRITRIRSRVAWDDLSMLVPTTTELLRLQTCTSYAQTAPRFIVDAEPIPSN